MNKMLSGLILLLLPAVTQANPYFRPIDLKHPQPVFGALLDPTDLKQSAGSSLVPLITHSPMDGCLVPWLICEDWTPLAVGASLNAGKLTFDVAPLANVLPWMQQGLRAVTPEDWTTIQALLQTEPSSPSVAFSAGPVWEYQQRTDKGYFKIFTGLALKF